MSGAHSGPRGGNQHPLAVKRRQFGMTQQQLADALGVTQTQVSRWERGGCVMRVETLRRVAELFRCDMEELVE